MTQYVATLHARARAVDRYGIWPSDGDWNDVLVAITSAVMGLAAPAKRLGLTRSGEERWLVRLAGTAVIAAYCPRTATIITLLDPRLNARERAFVHK